MIKILVPLIKFEVNGALFASLALQGSCQSGVKLFHKAFCFVTVHYILCVHSDNCWLGDIPLSIEMPPERFYAY